MKIRIFEIKINPGRREADPEAVQKLVGSISEVGLMNPITIDQDYTLIAGLHRLEAAKLLGWAEIECTVRDLEGLLAQLAEIDENLIRREYDQVEEWDQLARRKEIYETLHPETKNGISQAIAMNTAQGKNVNAPGALTSKSFVSDTSEKLGISKRTIEENLQLAKNLTPETKKIIQRTSEKVKKKDMLKLSRLAPEIQEEAATQLAAGKIRSVDEYHPAPTEPKAVEEQTPEIPLAAKPPAPSSGSPALLVSGTSYYPTIRDSVADLKNPDKDRRCTPDSFLVTFSYFLQRFCQSMDNYTGPEYDAVLPVLTQEHLNLIRQKIQLVHGALDELLNKIERKAQNGTT